MIPDPRLKKFRIANSFGNPTIIKNAGEYSPYTSSETLDLRGVRRIKVVMDAVTQAVQLAY